MFLYCSLFLLIYSLFVFINQFDGLIYSIFMNIYNSNIIKSVHKYNIQVICIYISLVLYNICFNSIIIYFTYAFIIFNSLIFRFSLDLLFNILNIVYLHCLFKVLILEFNVTNSMLLIYNHFIFNL